MPLIEWLQPSQISVGEFWFLVLISSVTSWVTAVMGMGGGVTMLALLANIVPATVAIPIHAVVQLGSTSGRVLTLWRHTEWTMVMWFSIGGVIGAFFGGQLAVNIPPHYMLLALGSFILYSSWLPLYKGSGSRRTVSLLGAGTSFVAMIVGGVAPFVFSFLQDVFEDRRALMASVAAMITVQQALKAVIFGLFGFAFADWSGMIVLMIITGFMGTLAGKYMFEKIPHHYAKPLMRTILTVLALRLLYMGVKPYLPI